MPSKRKILFLGEAYRADAITWMQGLREFGGFEITAWELKRSGSGLGRIGRLAEYLFCLRDIRKTIRKEQPDMVIAERTTSYGFLAAVCGLHPVAIAQQGRTDLWPEHSILMPLKRWLQHKAFAAADLIHAWGPVMTVSMRAAGVDMNKVMVLPKGIDIRQFTFRDTTDGPVRAIVTRSLLPEYRHDVILQAFFLLHQKGLDFTLTIVGDGCRRKKLEELSESLGLSEKVHFTGRIPNTELPALLADANFYVSMPITEGVSASLFEAMAAGCYPVVTDLPGNSSWIANGENGQLVPADHPEALAQQIAWAIRRPELRKKAVAGNRAFVERHADYTVNMKTIADRYHRLINEHQAHVRH